MIYFVIYKAKEALALETLHVMLRYMPYVIEELYGLQYTLKNKY